MTQESVFQVYKILDREGYANTSLLGKLIKFVESESLGGDLIDLMAARTAHTLSTIVSIYMVGQLGKEPGELSKTEIEEFYEIAKLSLNNLDQAEGWKVDRVEDRRPYFPLVDGYMKRGVRGSGKIRRIIQHTDKKVTLHSEANGAEWYRYWVMVNDEWQEYDSDLHGDLDFDLQGHFAPKLSTRLW